MTVEIIDETQPLLRAPNVSDADAEAQQGAKPPMTPLPKVQFGVLCYLRMLDPLNFSQIFPYINSFITLLNVTDDPSKIGIYSGIVESAFAVFQLLSTYSWASASDIVGRRPVILAGVAGLAITTIMLGFSQSFTAVLVARALAGMASGNGPVIATMVCDITDETNQAYAFPFLGIWWPAGQILGPLIGGIFSEAPKLPMFSSYQIWKDFPILMPCLVIALFNLVGFVLSYFYLKETLETKIASQKGETPAKPVEVYGAKMLFRIPIINALCNSSCALSFISTAFDVVFVLYCYTPVERGGLNLSIAEIGYALAIAGFSSTLLQIFIVPVILLKCDHFNLYYFFMRCWPWTFLSMPILHIIAKATNNEAGHTGAGLWVALAAVVALSKVACLAYAINILLVKRASPGPSAVGSTMGLLSTAICVPRAVAPAFVSYAFSVSSEYNLLHGYLWTVIMALLSAGATLQARKVVREGHALGRA